MEPFEHRNKNINRLLVLERACRGARRRLIWLAHGCGLDAFRLRMLSRSASSPLPDPSTGWTARVRWSLISKKLSFAQPGVVRGAWGDRGTLKSRMPIRSCVIPGGSIRMRLSRDGNPDWGFLHVSAQWSERSCLPAIAITSGSMNWQGCSECRDEPVCAGSTRPKTAWQKSWRLMPRERPGMSVDSLH